MQDESKPKRGKAGVLTDKQRLFCEEYVISLNASDAILKAGYAVKPGNQNRIATVLLHNDKCTDYIKKLMAKRMERTQIDQTFVINEIVSIIQKTRDGEAFNAQAALRGLELLAKHLGMFVDKTEITGRDGEAIKYEKIEKDANDLESRITDLAARARKAGLASVPNTGTEG